VGTLKVTQKGTPKENAILAAERRDLLGTVVPYAVVGLSEVAGLVTDAPAGHPAVQQLREQGVNVIQA
jgi:hypothetical protein